MIYNNEITRKTQEKLQKSSSLTCIPFTLYRSDFSGNLKNPSYPIKHVIRSCSDLLRVLYYDNTPHQYTDSYRKNSHWEGTDCIIVDCDNDDAGTPKQWDDPEQWITLEKVQQLLHGIEFYYVPSKSNLISKKGRAPRPKFHLYLPLGQFISEPEEYQQHCNKLKALCTLNGLSHADERPLGRCSFFTGLQKTKPQYFSGKSLLELLKTLPSPETPRKRGNTTQSPTIKPSRLDNSEIQRVIEYLIPYGCISGGVHEGKNYLNLKTDAESTQGGYFLYFNNTPELWVSHPSKGSSERHKALPLNQWLQTHYPEAWEQTGPFKTHTEVQPAYDQSDRIPLKEAQKQLNESIHNFSMDLHFYQDSKKEFLRQISDLKQSIKALMEEVKILRESSLPIKKEKMKELREQIRPQRQALKELKEELKQLKPPRQIIKVDAGLGKTTAVIQNIVGAENTLHFLVPTHALGDELFEKIKLKHPTLNGLCLKGRDQEGMCLLPQAIKGLSKQALKKRIPFFSSFCCQKDAEGELINQCTHFNECPYLNQFREQEDYGIQGYDFVIATHDALLTPHNSEYKLKTPDLVVIDENFTDKFNASTELKQEEVERYLEQEPVVQSELIQADRLLLKLLKYYAWGQENLRDYLKKKIESLKLHLSTPCTPDSLWEEATALKEIAQSYHKATEEEKIQMKEELEQISSHALTQCNRRIKDTGGSGIIPQMSEQQIKQELRAFPVLPLNISRFLKLLKEHWEAPSFDFFRATTHYENGVLKEWGLQMFFLKTPKNYSSLPLLTIDADASLELTQKILGHPFHCKTIRTLRPQLYLTLVHSALFSKKRLSDTQAEEDLKKIKAMIQTRVQSGLKVLLITYKSIEHEFEGLGCDTEHFGGYLGVDAYDKHHCVFVLGRNQMPLKRFKNKEGELVGGGLEEIGAGIWGGEELILTKEENSWNEEWRQIETTQGQKKDVKVSVHPDPRLNDYQQRAREAQTIQGIARSRDIHSPYKKEVIVFSNVPLDLPISRVTSFSELNRIETLSAEIRSKALKEGKTTLLSWAELKERPGFKSLKKSDLIEIQRKIKFLDTLSSLENQENYKPDLELDSSNKIYIEKNSSKSGLYFHHLKASNARHSTPIISPVDRAETQKMFGWDIIVSDSPSKDSFQKYKVERMIQEITEELKKGTQGTLFLSHEVLEKEYGLSGEEQKLLKQRLKDISQSEEAPFRSFEGKQNNAKRWTPVVSILPLKRLQLRLKKGVQIRHYDPPLSVPPDLIHNDSLPEESLHETVELLVPQQDEVTHKKARISIYRSTMSILKDPNAPSLYGQIVPGKAFIYRWRLDLQKANRIT